MATFTRRANGRWQVKIRRLGHPSLSRTFSDKASGQAWARQVEVEMDRGRVVSIQQLRKITLADVLGHYLHTAVSEMSPSGAVYARLEIERFLSMPISARSLDGLRRRDFTRLRDNMLRQHRNNDPQNRLISPATVLRRLSILRSAIQRYIDDGEIEGWESPITGMKMPRPSDQRERRIEPDELIQLVAAWRIKRKERIVLPNGTVNWKPLGKHSASQGCRNRYIPLAVRLAMETGMRRGEMLKVEIKNIYPDRGYLVLHPETTKTDRGHTLSQGRRVPLTLRAIELIRRIQCVKGRAPDEPLLFPISSNALKKGWQRLIKRAGLEGRDLRYHDTRAESASRCLEEGLSTFEAMAQTGHRDHRSFQKYVRMRSERIAFKRNELARKSKEAKQKLTS